MAVKSSMDSTKHSVGGLTPPLNEVSFNHWPALPDNKYTTEKVAGNYRNRETRGYNNEVEDREKYPDQVVGGISADVFGSGDFAWIY